MWGHLRERTMEWWQKQEQLQPESCVAAWPCAPPPPSPPNSSAATRLPSPRRGGRRRWSSGGRWAAGCRWTFSVTAGGGGGRQGSRSAMRCRHGHSTRVEAVNNILVLLHKRTVKLEASALVAKCWCCWGLNCAGLALTNSSTMGLMSTRSFRGAICDSQHRNLLVLGPLCVAVALRSSKGSGAKSQRRRGAAEDWKMAHSTRCCVLMYEPWTSPGLRARRSGSPARGRRLRQCEGAGRDTSQRGCCTTGVRTRQKDASRRNKTYIAAQAWRQRPGRWMPKPAA